MAPKENGPKRNYGALTQPSQIISKTVPWDVFVYVLRACPWSRLAREAFGWLHFLGFATFEPLIAGLILIRMVILVGFV